jgi:hypothetical protein
MKAQGEGARAVGVTTLALRLGAYRVKEIERAAQGHVTCMCVCASVRVCVRACWAAPRRVVGVDDYYDHRDQVRAGRQASDEAVKRTQRPRATSDQRRRVLRSGVYGTVALCVMLPHWRNGAE